MSPPSLPSSPAPGFGASPLLSSELARQGAPWLSGSGADADVVISSRVRLARNFTGFPFLTRATHADRARILAFAKDRLASAGIADRLLMVDIHDASSLERTFMVERHLISKEHARGTIPGQSKDDPAEGSSSASSHPHPSLPTAPAQAGSPAGSLLAVRGVGISIPDETVSIMINEEDHLRMQVLRSGLDLTAAFARVNDVDDRLPGALTTPVPSSTSGGHTGAQGDPARLEFAFSPRFGYLTACPTNVGTGIRVSVMLHLPALKLMGEMEKVRRATRDMSLALRGYYGENSEAAGEFYQISNQTTLGKPESVILHEIETEIIPQVIAYERTARRTMLEKRRRLLEDKVFRALALLRGARLLTPEEAITLLSDLRLGIIAGLVKEVPEPVVNQLILLTQPAHLQVTLGRELDQQQRREARADLVRARLSESPAA